MRLPVAVGYRGVIGYSWPNGDLTPSQEGLRVLAFARQFAGGHFGISEVKLAVI